MDIVKYSPFLIVIGGFFLYLRFRSSVKKHTEQRKVSLKFKKFYLVHRRYNSYLYLDLIIDGNQVSTYIGDANSLPEETRQKLSALDGLYEVEVEFTSHMLWHKPYPTAYTIAGVKLPLDMLFSPEVKKGLL